MSSTNKIQTLIAGEASESDEEEGQPRKVPEDRRNTQVAVKLSQSDGGRRNILILKIRIYSTELILNYYQNNVLMDNGGTS